MPPRSATDAARQWRRRLQSRGAIAIVTAHPDDEVIGVGGQLLRWTAVRPVIIVSVTDGAPPDEQVALEAGFATRAEYAGARRRELHSALAWLPAAPRVVHLGATDQRVTHELEMIARELGRVLDVVDPEIVVTHAYEGGHQDHDALALALSRLVRRGRFAHLEFAGYHEGPDGALQTNRFGAGTSVPAVRLPLDAPDRRLKRLMLSCFRTQVQPLSAFGCAEEWLRPAPDYDFSAPPNGGRVWYDHFNWGLTSREWLARVADDI